MNVCDHDDLARRILYLLRKAYGRPARIPPPLNNKTDPLDELIFIMVTLLTHEKNVNRAYENLKVKFPRWSDIIDADVRDLIDALRVAGLANQKALRIKRLLEDIYRRNPRVSLDFLRNWPNNKIEGFLTSLDGVGKKTARCVMMYSLGREVFPVDTHVFRVLRRVGLLSADISYDKSMDILQPLVPRKLRFEMHVNLVRHGREVCTALRPKCNICMLRSICNSYQNDQFIPPPFPPQNSRPRH